MPSKRGRDLHSNASKEGMMTGSTSSHVQAGQSFHSEVILSRFSMTTSPRRNMIPKGVIVVDADNQPVRALTLSIKASIGPTMKETDILHL